MKRSPSQRTYGLFAVHMPAAHLLPAKDILGTPHIAFPRIQLLFLIKYSVVLPYLAAVSSVLVGLTLFGPGDFQDGVECGQRQEI